MVVEASCPGCGAPIQFDVANSIVKVCSSCGNVVGRGDGKLEDYGKVAELVQTDSPLQIGLNGRVKGKGFEITGRVQLQHAAGGVWDEWYCALDNGEKWAWLAEAQGKYYLTMPKKLPEDHSIPLFEELEIEDEVTIPTAGVMKVVEIGEATAVAAEGEIPYAFQPGEVVKYADLEGAATRFATLDASDGPLTLYLGIQVSLEQIGLASAESREIEERTATAVGVTCPHCGGSLDLKAPDQTQRVCCPFCGSLLEADQGNLKFLQTLSQKQVKPVIPLGTEGELRGRKYTVIGFMQRKVTYEGRDYPWQEYLLYTPRQDFHWLVQSTNHWTLGRPVLASTVRASSKSATHSGKSFQIYERSVARVSAVYGEFYWKVSLGEEVRVSDYICPPYVLSREESATPVPAQQRKSTRRGRGKKKKGKSPGTSREVNYTLGEYVPTEEIEAAFGVKGLKRPTTVGINQPYPHKSTYRVAMILLVVALLAGALVYVSASRRKAYSQTLTMKPGANTFIGEPFELKSLHNICIRCSTPQAGRWAYVEAVLFNEKNAKVNTFTVAVPQKRAGPGKKSMKFLSAVPKGSYTLQLTTKWQDSSTRTQTLQVDVLQGVPRPRYFLALLIAILIVPIAVAAHHFHFETRRWQDSDFSPFSS